MKRTFLTYVSLVAVIVLSVCMLALSGCSQIPAENVIKMGASATPHAQILAQVKAALANEGYDLEIIEYNDYIQPNVALISGELDANYFQHITYLDEYNVQNNTNIESAGAVHLEPFGLYAGRCSSLEGLEDGATIAVPNDTTNEARALELLQQEGLIKLRDGVGLSATVVDIVENPKALQIKEVEAAQLPRSLQDVDIAAINGNYALGAGLSPKDALAVEDSDSDAATAYANIIAVPAGTENEPKIQALMRALQSDNVRQYMEDTFQGGVVPAF